MDAQQCVKLSLTNRSSGLIPFRLAPPGERTIPSRPVMNIPDALPKGQSCRLGPPVRQLPAREAADRRDPNCPTIPAREWSNEYSGHQKERSEPNDTIPIGNQSEATFNFRQDPAPHPSSTCACPALRLPGLCLDDLVAMARGQTPDPIPNSAVKTLSADGTAS